MARLKAVGIQEANFSQQSEAVQSRQYEESTAALNDAPVATGNTFKIFKLSDTKKNGKYHMEGIDDVWNEMVENKPNLGDVDNIKVDKFLTYLEDTWIKEKCHIGRDLWNIFDQYSLRTNLTK